MTAFYKGTVYECDYGRCKDDEGNPIWPGYKESWDVDLTALAPRATAALLAAQPLIVAVRDAARAAIVEYVDDEPDAAVVGGSSTIGCTFAVDEHGHVTQIYILQKRWGVCLMEDYAGSFRFEPVVELMFAEDTKVYNLDLDIVRADESFRAEAVAWAGTIVTLGRARRTWAAYDMCVALKLIDATTRPPTPPNYGTWTEGHHWKETLKPWPAFPRRSKRARH